MKFAITSSLILGGAFARTLMVGLPNIEPVMLVTLVSGVKYGWKHGLITGFLVMMLSDMLIYGTVPYFALALPLGILATTSILTNTSYAFIGFLSGFFRNRTRRVELVGLAAFLTIVYDLLTNMGIALVWGITIPHALLQGIPFMVLHLLGNIVIVGICAPYLLRAISLAEARTSEPIPIIHRR